MATTMTLIDATCEARNYVYRACVGRAMGARWAPGAARVARGSLFYLDHVRREYRQTYPGANSSVSLVKSYV